MRIFGQYVPVPILLLAAVEFGFAGLAFMLSASLFATYLSEEQSILPMTSAMLFASAVLVGLTAMGLYQVKQRLQIEGVITRVALALGIAATVIALMELLFSLGVDDYIWMLSFGASLALLSVSRLLYLRLADHDAFRRSVLVLGAGERAGSLLTLRRRSDQRGFRIAAFVPWPGDRGALQDERIVQLEEPLLSFAKRRNVTEIVVAMDDRRQGFPLKDLLDCKLAGITVVDLLAFLERETGKVKVDLLNPGWLIFSDGFGSKGFYRFGSRGLDLIVGCLFAFFAAPIMALVALAIVLEDGFPVCYRQRRVGLHGRVFTLYKFRSMVKDAESDGQARWAGDEDPRITYVGRVIRKLRLDELPQLFNVTRGDMSLVGPRPERPEFVESLSRRIPFYHERHSVKPGITGWAQLCYPYGSSEHDALEKLHYDLYYVKHKSVIFDLMVLLQTVEVICWRKGAR